MVVTDLVEQRRDMVCLLSAQWRRQPTLLRRAGYSDIEDLVQDVVLTILGTMRRGLSTYSPSRAAWSTYLHCVSRTVVLQRVRYEEAGRRRQPVDRIDDHLLGPSSFGRPDEWLDACETLETRRDEVEAAIVPPPPPRRSRVSRCRRHRPALATAI